ncbi:C3 and PZP-like alpha-2-macroglobulin domain-containing protein 8 [Drosophila eugracilis]|uniref:C3 and PZP-like alpha-2-macroglobulin domain-containing protein 8 n=1 Tax=Drosophila eugracilis TaxID=29029 RepID=UPI001BDAF47D|nr:C3 and PZP-like alpha-2-macroglobulin domain-containing protein 8 [Drosophila eugracilis]
MRFEKLIKFIFFLTWSVFTVLAPGYLQSNRDYILNVVGNDIKEPINLVISITGTSYNVSQKVKLDKVDNNKQVTFKLPDLEEGEYNLRAEGILGLEYRDTRDIIWESPTPIVYVQTNKFTYQPGDTIHYRVLVLDELLRPNLNAEKVVVLLRDDNYKNVEVVRPKKTKTGVYTGKFNIPKDADLGRWQIIILDSEGHEYKSDDHLDISVDVIPYKLPKFVVTMNPPEYFSYNDYLQFEINAEYIYGPRVNGDVVVVIELLNNYQPLGKTVTINGGNLIDGKAKIDASLKDLLNHFNLTNSYYMANVTAIINEYPGGAKVSKEKLLHLVRNRNKATCINNSCIRPPYNKEIEVVVKITTLNGTLVNDTAAPLKLKYLEKLTILSNRYERSIRIPEIENRTFYFDGKMNESGIAVFKVMIPEAPNDKLYLRDYKIWLEYAGEELAVQLYYPGSNPDPAPTETQNDVKNKKELTLQIHGPRNSKGEIVPMKIGNEYQVTLSSLRPFKYFDYNLVGRGGVILHNERIDFTEPLREYNFTIKTTHLTSPRVYIHAFYVDQEGVMQYAETNYQVLVDLPNEITVSAPESGSPGEKIDLLIKTEPNSFIGIMAVDERLRNFNYIIGDFPPHDLDERLINFHTASSLDGSKSGLFLMTNANLTKKRCSRSIHTETKSRIETSLKPVTRPKRSAVGDDLPWNSAETLIFADIERTENEVTKYPITLPNKLGSWTFTVFSLHPEKGLGVAKEMVKVTTFQQGS